jgi:transketolase
LGQTENYDEPPSNPGSIVHRHHSHPSEVILLASGSEVSLCILAYEQLRAEKIRARVVSMPSWELFERQHQSYKDAVLPPTAKARIAVEQASPVGWHRYVGSNGCIIGMNSFGASAPLKALQEKFGFTAERIVSVAKSLVAKKS